MRRLGSFLARLCLLLLFFSTTTSILVVRAQLEIIGAGYGRTGTDSMRMALNILGYQTYHMREIFAKKKMEDVRVWTDFFKQDLPISKVAKDIFENEGYTATVDFPSTGAWKELATHYPNAKIILTERDSPEQWWESASETIFRPSVVFGVLRKVLPFFRNAAVMMEHMCQYSFGIEQPRPIDTTKDKETCINAYQQNSIDARAFDPSRTLVFNVKEGWEPLCTFLGKEIPKDIPFPHANTKSEFGKRFHKMLLAALVLLLILSWVVISILKKYFGNNKKGGGSSASKKKD